MNRWAAPLLGAWIGLGFAAGASAQSAQISNRAVVLVQSYSGGAAIRYSPAATANGCAGTSADQHVWIDWSGDANRKAMLALVMLAAAQGKTVGFGVNGCYGGYGGGVPSVYRVDLAP